MSPLDEEEAKISLPYWSPLRDFIQASEVTPHIWDLICAMLGYFLTVFSPRMSHTLTILSNDPTAMYFELGEKAHVLSEDGFSLTFGLKLWSMSLFYGFYELTKNSLASCPQLAMTLSVWQWVYYYGWCWLRWRSRGGRCSWWWVVWTRVSVWQWLCCK